jgi:putative endonuclease
MIVSTWGGMPAITPLPGFYRMFRHSADDAAMASLRSTAHAAGLAAEDAACAALVAEGWLIRARRLRTKAGEVDIAAEKQGVLAIIEVKHRPTLAEAAFALSAKQQARLVGACDIILAEHPDWGRDGVRFDVVLVDAKGRVRRITDAFRSGD